MSQETAYWCRIGTTMGPTRPATVWDPEKNKYVPVLDAAGARRQERIPQTGMIGDNASMLRKAPMHTRAVYAMRPDGNWVWRNYTPSAAAPLRPEDVSRVHGEMNRDGWIREGCCPIRETYAGLNRRKLVSAECGPSARPCDEGVLGVRDSEGNRIPPCPHVVAEQAARRAGRRAQNSQAEDAHRKIEDKQLEAIREGNDVNRELAAAIRAQAEVMATAREEPKAKK